MVIKLMRSNPLNLHTILQIIHSKRGWVWRSSTAVPALGRLKEESHKFEAIPSYIEGWNKVTYMHVHSHVCVR